MNSNESKEQVSAQQTVNRSPKSRRRALKMFGYLGLGGVLGTASSTAQAGLGDALMSIIKKLLKAAVAGIALFYAWRFIKHSSDSIKSWMENQVENMDQNGQDDAVSQAKYADGVNVGTQIVGNAEIMADYDPPEEACDIASVGKVSSSMHANGKAYSLALLEKLHQRVSEMDKKVDGSNTVRELKVAQITMDPQRLLNSGLLLKRGGYTEDESADAMAVLELLTGELGTEKAREGKHFSHLAMQLNETGIRGAAIAALTDIVARRVKSAEFTEDFIASQSDPGLKALAESATKDGGLSVADVLIFEAQRQSTTEYNVKSLSLKVSATPLYKKMLYVKSSQMFLLTELNRLRATRSRLEASALISSVKKGVA